MAVGIDALFMEVHACPDKALCDGPNMLSLDELPALLETGAADRQDRKMTIEQAKRVLRIEADAVAALIDRIDATFEQAVDMVLNSKGRVVVTGMGKSG